MLSKHGIIVGCITLLLSSYLYASCGSSSTTYVSSSCGVSDDILDDSGPYTSTCQCASDPNCGTVDTDCISRSECCQAFGNIGAR